MLQRPQLADQRAQLRGGGHEHADLAARKLALFGRLHDQHALQRAPIDQRHPEQRVVNLLAGLGKELEPRMPRRRR